MTFSLGDYRSALERGLDEVRELRLAQRIWERDHTVWQPDPTEISNRLGWLECPAAMQENLAEISGFVEEVRTAGYTHALLLGMGGSSLAPAVFRTTFGVTDGYLDLSVLDTTDPLTVQQRVAVLDPVRTLFIVSTKSGGTVETLSLFRYCYRQVVRTVGTGSAGAHFVAITDPGSSLDRTAAELGFRRTFRNDPNIGGRYSALSYFGLVPAALVGVNLDRLLQRARIAADHCRSEDGNPGLGLGVTLGALARGGRDKLTLLLPPPVASFGDWVEQLVAESLGKQGIGILPVVGEPLGAPGGYAGDRLFVALSAGGLPPDGTESLAAAGHPLQCLPLEDSYDLGYQFFLWEFATVVAGSRLGVNPFDQPDVESAKVRAKEMVATYRESGTLPAPPPTLEADGVGIWAEFPVGSAVDALSRFVGQATPGDYLSIQAYLPPVPAVDTALTRLRAALSKRTGLAVTVGYGPRFLHSTGQLHKGDAGNGRFLQLTCEPAATVPIPDTATGDEASLDFGVLIAAQALGDRQALLDAGRPVLRLHLATDPAPQLEDLTAKMC